MSPVLYDIPRGLFVLGILVLVGLGCSGGKAVTLPKNPAEVLRPVDYDTVYAVSEVDQRPQPEGGMSALVDRMEYPEPLIELGIGGRVLVEFIVSPNGRPTNVEVAKGAHPDLDREARRVILASPFEPGRRNGEAVPVGMMLPLTFHSSALVQ